MVFPVRRAHRVDKHPPMDMQRALAVTRGSRCVRDECMVIGRDLDIGRVDPTPHDFFPALDRGIHAYGACHVGLRGDLRFARDISP